MCTNRYAKCRSICDANQCEIDEHIHIRNKCGGKKRLLYLPFRLCTNTISNTELPHNDQFLTRPFWYSACVCVCVRVSSACVHVPATTFVKYLSIYPFVWRLDTVEVALFLFIKLKIVLSCFCLSSSSSMIIIFLFNFHWLDSIKWF